MMKKIIIAVLICLLPVSAFAWTTGTLTVKGNSTFEGNATFDNIPSLPASDPTTDNQAARKAYVDRYANASNLASGTVPTARLGSGTANATTFLRGDQSWQEVNTTPGAGTITSTMLKTSTGEVSKTGGSGHVTLPGGEYGFYPQIKMSKIESAQWGAVILLDGSYSGWTGYVTNIFLNGQGGTLYARQRYVTTSGEDIWIFLLVDKNTKEIITAYQAPDHPAYGNGGDFEKVPHPFGSYDETKQEIVLVDKETCLTLKTESQQIDKSILTLIHEGYSVDMGKEQDYQPLHSGKFLKEDKDGKEVQVKQMVNAIPHYIKIRKLIKLSG